MSMPEASPSSIPPRPADGLDEAEKTQPTQPFLTEDIEYDDDGFEEDAFSDDADAVEVIIPEGLKEGTLFIALVGNEEFEVTVPPGLKGGDTLALDVPVSHMAGPEVDSHDAVPNGKKKIPKRQVSFTEEEPSVVLFRPELGGLGLTKQPETEEIETSPQIMYVLDIVIPPDVSPGVILEVESDAGEMIEVVVPEGMEPGMTLTVESPMSKQTQIDFGGAAPEQHNPPSEEGVQQETKKQTEADSSPMAAVEVSEDVFAGDVLEMESPEGERIEVVVPEDAETGKTLTVESPKSKQTQIDFGGAAPEQDKVPSEEPVKQDTNPPEKPSDSAPLLSVVVPEGVFAGDVLEVESPEGERIEVVVPKDTKAGKTLTVESPKSKQTLMDFGGAAPKQDKVPPEEPVKLGTKERTQRDLPPEKPSDSPPLLSVVVPEDVFAGDVLEVESPEGERIEVVVPEDTEAGKTLTVESPKSKKTQIDFGGAAPEQDKVPSEEPVKLGTKERTQRDLPPEKPSDSPPLLSVVVPEDVFAGDVLEVESPEGERIEVVVPEDMEAGKTLTVESPKSKQTQIDFGGAAPEQDKVPSEEPVKQDTNPPEKQSDSAPLLSVVVPEDVFAGDVLEVESPEGERIEVVVPEDTEAGKTLTVESPKSKKTQIDFGGAAPEQDKVPSEEPVKLGTKERTQRDLPPEKPSDSPPLLSVVVPEDVFAGDILEVESPEGERIEVVVPTDTEAGKTLTVESPMSKQTQIDFGGAAPEQDKVPSENQVGQGRSDKTNEAPLQTEILAESQQSKEAEMKPEEATFLKQDNSLAQEQTLQDGKGRSKQGFDSLKHSDFPTILAVLIPEGAVAGDLLQVEPDTGETVEVTVPRGMEAGMTMTVADLGSGWQPVTDRLGEVLQSGGDLEMSLLSHAEMDSILQPLPPQPLQSGLSEELLAVPNNSAVPGKSDRSAWRTLTQLGGGEVMKLRRWPESGLSVKSEEDPPQDSGKVEVAVQTESVDFTLYPIGLKAHPLSAWGGPALPPLPSCGLHCKMPLVQETTNGNISLVAMKLALESLQREKEDLERKLKESQKEVLRLELRDEDAIKAMEVRQNVLLRQENDEMRKIALAALRHREEGREVCRKKKGNKMERKSLEVKDTWLQAPPKQARVKRSEQVTVEDLETPSEAIASPVGHAGGSHGVRRIRSHSDSSVAEAKELSTKRKYGSADSEKGELGQPVHASPCGSAKDPQASKHRSTKPVVRLKPKDTTITKYDPDPGSCRSSQSKTTWRVRAEAETDETGPGWSSSAVDARLATASIYTAAALSADTLGWGATAAAAQSVGIRKTRSEEARNAMMQPLNDTSEAALVCERAVSGAFVLESGQQEPDLRCADEFNESAAYHQNLAKEDVELRDFFAGSAYSSGSHLADCCPSYILVDDGSGVADAVPVYRHVKSGCLLLSFPVSLVSPDTPDEDIRLFFCRGPLPLMRRYGRGVLGCMEILFELFADTEGINGHTGSEFYGLCEGPGHETGETGSAESLCYLPILVDKQHVRSSPSWVDASKKHSQCFIKLPDMVASAGFAFGMMERRLKAEVYHSDGEGRAVRLLAHFFACLGRAEEAAVLWDQASQEDEAKLGSDHLQTASSFAALAACFDDLGRSEDAEAFHSKALAAMAKNFGRSSSEAVACELGLAACRHVQGKCKLHGMLPATQSGVLCLEGAAAHAIAVIFSQAAGDEREEAEAEVLYRQGLSILRRCLGPGHADTLHCLNNLALCMADQGKIQQAEQLLRRTVAGMEMVLAPTHPRPIQALSNLACCLAEQGKVEEAETNHRRAFENAKKRLGWQHPETSACAQSLAQFLTSCGRCTEAALLELQADQLGRPCWKRGRT